MPRSDTASIAQLSDGRLMVVYHKYEKGKNAGHDHGFCRIWSKTSSDGGVTWKNPRMLVDVAKGDMNVQAPGLLRTKSGRLLMNCLRAHKSGGSSTMCFFSSSDEGKTFTEHDPLWLRLIGPNQWPIAIPEMPSLVSAWSAKMNHVSMQLFRALALGLGHPYHYFDTLMEPNPYFRIKISRYPAQHDVKNARQGLGLHHDSGLFTLIMQNQVSGLQVERDGQLLTVEPLPGAFVVNLGEMFQIATNGYLKATKHQVVSPAVGLERISVAYFMNPRLDAVFAPIPLSADIAASADGGQNSDPNDPIYSLFGENTLKIRMRSHPDVVAAHYPEAN